MLIHGFYLTSSYIEGVNVSAEKVTIIDSYSMRKVMRHKKTPQNYSDFEALISSIIRLSIWLGDRLNTDNRLMAFFFHHESD